MNRLFLMMHLLDYRFRTGGDVLFRNMSEQGDACMIPVVRVKNIGIWSAYKTTLVWTIPFVYLRRIIKFFIKPNPIENKYIISNDFLVNCVIAWYYRKQIIWDAYIFHVIPWHRTKMSIIRCIVSWAMQRMSFFIIKRYASNVMVLCNTVKYQLMNLGFKEEKIVVKKPTIDIKFIDTIQADVKRYTAIYVGRIDVMKGVYDLPALWSIAACDNRDAIMGIIGTGNTEILDTLINEYAQVDKIDILTNVSDAEKFRIMKSSDIFIMPSKEEGYCLAIDEALYCGMKVFAYDIPVFREVYGDRITYAQNRMDMGFKILNYLRKHGR